MNTITKILSEIQPYVYVVGSYARGTQTNVSDIDVYIKRRSEKELEEHGYYDGKCEEHYIDKVIASFEKHNVEWSSVIMGHVASESLSTMIEASSLYHVEDTIVGENERGEEELIQNEKLEIFPITLFGVEMLATIDTYKVTK